MASVGSGNGSAGEPPSPSPLGNLVTFKELAKLCGVTIHAVRNWKLHNKIPGLRKIMGRYWVDLDEFKRSTYPRNGNGSNGHGSTSAPDE